VEARGDARLSPGTFPDPPHALLPTHISLQKKSLDFVWPITFGHHCTTAQRVPIQHETGKWFVYPQAVGLKSDARDASAAQHKYPDMAQY